MPTQVDLLIKTKADTAELSRATREAQEFIDTLKLGVGIDLGGKVVEGLGEIPDQFREAVTEGVKFNSEVQDAQIGLAALVKNFEPTKFSSFSAAMAESARGILSLRQAELSSPFKFSTLLESLSGLSGPLYAGGVKELQKQVDLTVLLANAAKSVQLPEQVFQSDARDLVEGRVGRTLLGKALNINDADIAKAKQSVGGLYDYLEEKLQAFNEAGAASTDNLSTRFSKLQNRLQQVEGTSTEGIFGSVSDITDKLTKAISDPAFGNAAQTVGAEIKVITDEVGGLVETVAAHPAIFAAVTQGIFSFGAAMALLNLPKLFSGLLQLATNVGPAAEGLAAMKRATESEASAVAQATPKLDANTASLKANAAAAALAAEAQQQAASAPAVTGTSTVEGASDDAALAASTAATEANTQATVANNEATAASSDAVAQANAEAAQGNVLTQESTSLTDANSLATERNTDEINASNAAAVANNTETQASNALTEESTLVTNDNSASTALNTDAIDASNAAAAANNAETQRSNDLTDVSTIVTDQNTEATTRSNTASEQSLALSEAESAIMREEIALTLEGTAADNLSTSAVQQGNAAAAISVDVGKQEVKVITDENRAVDASTVKTLANTAAVKGNLAAVQGEASAERDVAQATAQATLAIEEQATALKTHAAEAEKSAAAGAGATAGEAPAGAINYISSYAGAATTTLLSLVQIVQAGGAFIEEINQANRDLGKQLDANLSTMKQEVDSVSNQADQTQLVSRLKDEQLRIENAIGTAKKNWFYTDDQALDALKDQLDAVGRLLARAENLPQTELDLRAATAESSRAIEDQTEKVGKLADGFDKARLAYAGIFAEKQLKGAPTLGQRLGGSDRAVQLEIDDLNKSVTDPKSKFTSAQEVGSFVDADSVKAKSDDLSAQAAAADAALLEKTKTAKGYADQLAALDARIADLNAHLFDPPSVPGTDPVYDALQKAKADRASLATQSDGASKAKEDANSTAESIRRQINNYDGLQSAAVATWKNILKIQESVPKTIAESEDSILSVRQAANKAAEEDNARSFKLQAETAAQFYTKQKALIESEAADSKQQIQNKPEIELPDDLKQQALAKVEIDTKAKLDALDEDYANKRRSRVVQELTEQQRLLAIQKDRAEAAGDINSKEDLAEQIAELQKRSEIEGDATIKEADKKQMIDEQVGAMQQLYQITKAQRDAEVSLETQEKQNADTLSQLQAKRQSVESSNLSPDAKNDALRQVYLQENAALNQQIALLEQRRQLALQDPSKSPNDRALTAAGVQGQITQAQQQQVGNNIAAQKLTFTGEFTDDLTKFTQNFGSTASQVASVVTSTLGSAVDSIAKGLTGIITGTESVKDAFISMVESAVDQLIELVLKLAITLALQEALDVAGVVSAPAAGAAAGVLSAGLGAAAAFASGGLIPGAPSHRDNRIATVASGEYVVRTAAVSHYGAGIFEAFNSMRVPRGMASFDMPVQARPSLGFADGGLVGDLPTRQSQSAPVVHMHHHVALINGSQAMHDFMRKGPGKKTIVDLASGVVRDAGLTG